MKIINLKKIIGVILTLAIILSVCGLNINAAVLQETEPNNGRASANIISFNDSYTGTINLLGDVDYYKFTTAVADIIRVDLTNIPSGKRYTLRLVDSNGVEILQNANTGTSKYITYGVSANTTYYIYVNGFQSNYSSTSPYSVTLKSINFSLRNNNYSPATLPIMIKRDDTIIDDPVVDGYFTYARDAWYTAMGQTVFTVNSNSTNVIYCDSYDDTWYGLYQAYTLNSTGAFSRFNLHINTRTINANSSTSTRPNYYRSVIVHELGHSLGLADNPVTNSDSIMDQGRTRATMITPQIFDIDAVKSKFGFASFQSVAGLLDYNGIIQPTNDIDDPIVEIHADYPQYNNLNELYEKADLVILCTNSSNEVRSMDIFNDTQKEEPFLYTISDVTINSVLKGNLSVEDSLEVKQLGGTYNNTLYIDSNVEQLKNNTQYLLFLETYENSPASLLNPTQGMYYVEGNTLRSRSENEIQLNIEQLLSMD
jgi:hypothetical protein